MTHYPPSPAMIVSIAALAVVIFLASMVDGGKPAEQESQTEIQTYDMGEGVRCYTLPGVPSISCVQVWKQFAE